jgi:hypothetical protein
LPLPGRQWVPICCSNFIYHDGAPYLMIMTKLSGDRGAAAMGKPHVLF